LDTAGKKATVKSNENKKKKKKGKKKKKKQENHALTKIINPKLDKKFYSAKFQKSAGSSKTQTSRDACSSDYLTRFPFSLNISFSRSVSDCKSLCGR